MSAAKQEDAKSENKQAPKKQGERRTFNRQEPTTASFSLRAPNRCDEGDPQDKKPAARPFKTEREEETPEYYNESTVVSKREIKNEGTLGKPQFVPTTPARRTLLDDENEKEKCQAGRDGTHASLRDSNEKQVHSASIKGEHAGSRARPEDMKAAAELIIALDDNSPADSKKETRMWTTFETEGGDIEMFGSHHLQPRALQIEDALTPRSRSQEISPGAFRAGGDTLDDEDEDYDTGTVTFSNDADQDQNPSSDSQGMHLISAERVQDPVLVSASIIDCLCCPYGRMTVIPATLGCLGSALSFLAAFMPFAYDCNANVGITGYFANDDVPSDGTAFAGAILGLISGIGGAIAFALSAAASCRTFPEWFLKLLGGSYLVLAVTSILMLVALASPSMQGQCVVLYWGGAFAVVAFFLYLVAGIFTFQMIKKKDVNRASVCACCPYGNLTAMPSVFGFIGAALILLAVVPQFIYPFLKIDYPSENFDMGPSISPLSPTYSPLDDGFDDATFLSVNLLGAVDDPALTFALTIGVIAGFVGSIVSVMSILPGCQKVPSKAFKTFGITYFVLGPMCLLTLVAFSSKECAGECSIGTGGIMALCAFFTFSAAGLSAFYLNKISSQARATSDRNV